MALELVNGGEVTSNQLRANHADVTFFVNKGNVLYVTVNGKRRYAIVPTHAGEEYLKTSTPAMADEAGDAPDGYIGDGRPTGPPPDEPPGAP